MPDRFDHDFSDNQARTLAHAFDLIWRRTLLSILLLFFGIAVGYGYAIHRVTETEHATTLNAQSIARASARLAFQNCQRFQDGRRALILIVHTAIPQQQPNRTPAQQAQVMAFYKTLNGRGVLKVPTCRRPTA